MHIFCKFFCYSFVMTSKEAISEKGMLITEECKRVAN